MNSKLISACVTFIWLIGGSAFGQTIRYVDDDAPGDPAPGNPAVSDPLEDGTLAHPYDAIQEAINASLSGIDSVVILDGTYTGVGNRSMTYAGKLITVQSQSGDPATVIINCQNSGYGFLFASGEPSLSVLQGVTITGGSGFANNGGAIVCSSNSNPTINNCVFVNNNVTDSGGAVDLSGSSPTFNACTLINNTANGNGGGVRVTGGSPVFSACWFENNSAVDGGGAYLLNTSASLDGCMFSMNAASANGGGVASNGSTVQISGCTFEANAGLAGSAFYNANGSDSTVVDSTFEGHASVALFNTTDGAEPQLSLFGCTFENNSSFAISIASPIDEITDCVFVGNLGATSGLGTRYTNCRFLGNTGPGSTMSIGFAHVYLTNCEFSGNVGFACVDASEAMIFVNNCTFANNEMITILSSVEILDDITVRNSIVWNGGLNPFSNGGSISVQHTNVEGGQPGTGNINSDPLFFDADGPDNVIGTLDDDLRIQPSSPSRNSGNNAALPADVVDLDGDLDTAEPLPLDLAGLARIAAGGGPAVVDMGAHEFDGALTAYVRNLTQATAHGSIEAAINVADHGDTLESTLPAFAAAPTIDFSGKPVTLRAAGALNQQVGGLYELADGATLAAASGHDMTIAGELRVDPTDTADVVAHQFSTAATGRLRVRAGGGLFISATGGSNLEGDTTLFTGATLGFTGTATNTGSITASGGATIDVDGDLTNEAAGEISLLNGVGVFADELTNAGLLQCAGVDIVADALLNDAGAEFVGNGAMYAPITNDGSAIYTGDMLAVGDYTNNDTTIVQIGTLTIIGSLINNGTIIGDVQTSPLSGSGGTQPGDGMSIQGNFIAGLSASLSMPDPVWRLTVSGHYDVAVNDHTLYHMVDAELRLSGGTSPQNLEIMSVDIGADSAGFDRTLPGHYPIGTLRIGPSLTTVNMVDVHDNDGLGQEMCEAIYARNLIVESGGTLNTNGCVVYYETLQLDGVVDEPLNLVQIAACPADTNDDTTVDVLDLLAVLGAWGPNPGHAADTNGDDVVDVLDLLAVLGAWGACG